MKEYYTDELVTIYLGDMNAVQKGKVGKRLARRGVGKGLGRILGRLFR